MSTLSTSSLHDLTATALTEQLRQGKVSAVETAQHFLARAGKELGVSPKILRTETTDYMQQLPWPGNVRQLENTCRWLTVMITGREVYPEDLPSELKQIPIQKPTEQNTTVAGFDRVSLHHWDELLGQWAIQKLKNGEMKILDIATPMFEKTLISAALQQTRGRKRHAAELLGWGSNTLTRNLKELGMDSTEDEDEEDEKTSKTKKSRKSRDEEEDDDDFDDEDEDEDED